MLTLPTDSTAARVVARLESMPGLKIKYHGDYLKLNSPLRPGSDSGDFKLTITDGEHGTWHDGPSGNGGSLYQLATELGVEAGRPQAAPVDTKRAYAGLSDYAEAHGVPADAYALAGWSEDTHGSTGRRALAIPTESGVRWRFLDGEKPAYINPAGYAPCWYGLKRAIDMATRRGAPIVLCNGEASTVAAQHHGVPACAITTGSERTLPDNLLAELRAGWSGPIVVALDCDQKGRDAAPKLAAQLRAAGYTAAPVDLGGANGFDLADFCRLYAEESYAVICELERNTRPKGRLIHNNDLRALPRPEYLIAGHIIRRGINVLYGASSAGKSFKAIDYSASVAQAENVIYVAAEDPGGYGPRVDAWKAHNQKDAPGLYFLPERVDALDSAQVDSLIAEVAPLRPALVVFDTLDRCIPGGDDGNAHDMGAFVTMCERVRDELGATVLAVHHTGKNGEYRGHSRLLGAADMFIRFEDLDGMRVLTVEKNKHEAPIDPVRLRLLPVGESCVVIPDENFDALRSTTMTPQQMRLMGIICLDLFEEKGISKESLSSSASVPPYSLYHSLSILQKRGYIVHGLGKSSNIFATDHGRDKWLEQYKR